MRNYAFATAIFGLAACAGIFHSELTEFRTSDVLELNAVSRDALDTIAKAGAVDGWKVTELDHASRVVSFQRSSNYWETSFGGFESASIRCTLAPDGRRLEISFFAYGSDAGQEYAAKEIAAFKGRVGKAFGAS